MRFTFFEFKKPKAQNCLNAEGGGGSPRTLIQVPTCDQPSEFAKRQSLTTTRTFRSGKSKRPEPHSCFVQRRNQSNSRSCWATPDLSELRTGCHPAGRSGVSAGLISAGTTHRNET